MRLSDMGEREIIKLITARLRKRSGSSIDFEEDAAVFSSERKRFVISTDMGFFSTHFTSLNPKKIAKKIVTSTFTDLLAKNSIPKHMLLSIGVPKNYDSKFLSELYSALDRELSKYGAFLIGGDTNSSSEFCYCATVIGELNGKFLPRNGAKAGDFIVLTGEIGNAAAGYFMKHKHLKGSAHLLKAQEEPSIDVSLCKKISKGANAGIDISDGLAFELGEMARLSKKKITMDWGEIPLSDDFLRFCKFHHIDEEELALNKGEDYQIAFSTPSEKHGIVVGKVSKGNGVFLRRNGKTKRISTKGYEHFIS